VYVDHARNRYRGMLMSHLVADTDEELERFAHELGLRPEWAQHQHYDISEGMRYKAIRHGARAVTTRQIIRVLRARRA
jgi:hypothetical protein